MYGCDATMSFKWRLRGMLREIPGGRPSLLGNETAPSQKTSTTTTNRKCLGGKAKYFSPELDGNLLNRQAPYQCHYQTYEITHMKILHLKITYGSIFQDGQLGIGDVNISNFCYTKINLRDDSAQHTFEVRYILVRFNEGLKVSYASKKARQSQC